MIVKLSKGDGWVYHQADQVFTSNDRFEVDLKENAYIYGEGDKQKKLSLRKVDGPLVSAYYTVGYLLNDDGKTINSL